MKYTQVSFRMITKNQLRASSTYIFMIALWAYSSIIYFRVLPEKEPLFMIQNCFYAQAVAMLSFLFVGMFLAQLEDRLEMEHINSFIQTTSFEFIFSKVLIIFACSIVYTTAVYAINCLVYAFLKCDVLMYKYALKMIISNFLIPTLICGVLGISLGLQCKSRLKYFITILIWLFINPLSLEITSYIAEISKTNLSFGEYFFSLLCCGARMQTGPTPMYGITFSSYKTLILFIKLVITIIYCLLIGHAVSKKIQSVHITNLVFILVFILVSLITYSLHNYKTIVYSSIPETQRARYEYTHYGSFYDNSYRVKDSLQMKENTVDNVHIEKYNISLTSDMCCIEVECDISLYPTKKITEQVFTLYRDFTVKSVLLNDVPILFEQKQDYVTVYFPYALAAKTAINLKWIYSGTSSPIFTANNDAVYLSACFPWLPEPGTRELLPYSAFVNTDMYLLYSGIPTNYPIKYELHFISPYTTYVNLDNNGNGNWAGLSSDGISVFSDFLMKHCSINEIDLFYPASLEQYIQKIFHTALFVENVKHNILNTTCDQPTIKRFVIPPVMPTITVDGVLRNYSMHEDLMLCFETPLFIQGYISRYTDHELEHKRISVIPDFISIEDAIDSIRNTPHFIKACAYDVTNRLFGQYLLLSYQFEHNLLDENQLLKKWDSFVSLVEDQTPILPEHWNHIILEIRSRLRNIPFSQDDVLHSWLQSIVNDLPQNTIQID